MTFVLQMIVHLACLWILIQWVTGHVCKFIILLAFYYASLAIEGNTYNCVDKFLRGQ